jgi:hypothetical protein
MKWPEEWSHCGVVVRDRGRAGDNDRQLLQCRGTANLGDVADGVGVFEHGP